MHENDLSDSRRYWLPIYRDPVQRQVIDPMSESDVEVDWRPAAGAAANLWRCVESLRDIHEALEAASSVKSRQRSRRLKGLAIFLMSFARETGRLCGQFATDPCWKNRLSPVQRAHFANLQKVLHKSVTEDSALRDIRDQYAAHVDKGLLPQPARVLLSRAKANAYGRWLHICIEVFLELLDFDLYSWRTADAPDGHFRAMNREPWILTFTTKEEGESVLVGIDVAAACPRQAAADLCKDVVAASQFLFSECDPRLVVNEPQVG
jgi:hypothetical protein